MTVPSGPLPINASRNITRASKRAGWASVEHGIDYYSSG